MVEVELADVTDNFVGTEIIDDANSGDCSDCIGRKDDEYIVEFLDCLNGGTADSEKMN